MENKWEELIKQQDSDVNVVEGFEWNYEDDILTDTKSILFNGYGFAIGTCSNTNETIVVELEYPTIEDLRDTDLQLISRHLGFTVDRNDVSIEDVASYFAEISQVL